MADTKQDQSILSAAGILILITVLTLLASMLPVRPGQAVSPPASLASPVSDAASSSDASAAPAITGYAGGAESRAQQQAQIQTQAHAEKPPTDIPTYPGVFITAYYIPIRADFPQWTTTNNPSIGGDAACHASPKGAFEAGKCNGQLKIGDKYYPQRALTIAESGVSGGATTPRPTHEGMTPTAHRTIAVNPVKGSGCYIPYGSTVFIEFPQKDNPWTGWYVAEDTGSAFQGKCKIDIFAGEGEAALQDAVNWVSGKTAKAYVCDANRDKCGAMSGTLWNDIGTYSLLPHFTADYPYDTSNPVMVINWARSVVQKCTDNTAACVQDAVTKFNTDHPHVLIRPTTDSIGAHQCDNGTYPAFFDFSEKVMDCMQNNQTDCLCVIPLINDTESAGKTANGHKTYVFQMNTSDAPGGKSTELVLWDVNEPISAQAVKARIPVKGNLISYRNITANQLGTWVAAFTSRTLSYKTDFVLSKFFTGDITLPEMDSAGVYYRDVPGGTMHQEWHDTPPKWLTLYKEDPENVSLVSPQNTARPMCKPRKISYRFCAIPDDALPWVKQQVDSGKVSSVTNGSAPVPIPFSLWLSDIPPSPVTQLHARQMIPDGGIEVTFQRSPSEDIEEYQVFCKAKDDFSDNKRPIATPLTPIPADPTRQDYSFSLLKCDPSDMPGFNAVDNYYILVAAMDRGGQYPAENPKTPAVKTLGAIPAP